MPQPFKAGSRELDLAHYIELGETYGIEERKNAARAGFLLLWGSVWHVMEKASFNITAVDRLLAFAGDDAAGEVAVEWKLVHWADVDEGSAELLLASRAYLRRSFPPNRTPPGSAYWSNVITTAKRCVIRAGLDTPAATIVPSDVLVELDLGRKNESS